LSSEKSWIRAECRPEVNKPGEKIRRPCGRIGGGPAASGRSRLQTPQSGGEPSSRGRNLSLKKGGGGDRSLSRPLGGREGGFFPYRKKRKKAFKRGRLPWGGKNLKSVSYVGTSLSSGGLGRSFLRTFLLPDGPGKRENHAFYAGTARKRLPYLIGGKPGFLSQRGGAPNV